MAFRVLPPHDAEYFGVVDLDVSGMPADVAERHATKKASRTVEFSAANSGSGAFIL